jgi:hypothetical protein
MMTPRRRPLSANGGRQEGLMSLRFANAEQAVGHAKVAIIR